MNEHNKKDWHKFKKEMQQNLNEEQAEEELPLEEQTEPEDSIPEEMALDHPSYTNLQEQLTLSEQKAHEYMEQSIRAMAELDNGRRRMERELSNAHKYGTEKLISALLPVVDSLEQALQIAKNNSDTAMQEGLELTMKLFLDALQKFDVQCIDPEGESFNPQEHEAMSILDVPGTPPNKVVNVFQKGYRLSDRVIRPARVIVSKKSEDN